MSPNPPSDPFESNSTREDRSASSSGGFGSYRLLERIGEGGMGEVWLAEQFHPLQRQVAIKLIKAGMDTAQVIARFDAERQALALMDHPAIATVFDGGMTPERRPYFAMEYVRGEAITTYCDRHRLSIRQRLELFILLCDGVQHAHQKGVIHRDLKPSNILVTAQGETAVPRIIDFGIAKATSRSLTELSLYTEVGALIGTPEYMSPEQAEMTALDVDTRSDVYSLGVVLYELLVGALPFDRGVLRAAGPELTRRLLRDTELPRPSTRASQVGKASGDAAKNRQVEPTRHARLLSGDLDWIILKALEKDRTRRYQTVNGLALDLQRHLRNEPVSAGPPSTQYRMAKFVRRHRFGVTAAAAVALLLVAFSVTVSIQAQRVARERDRANLEADSAGQIADFLVGLFKVSDPSESRGNTLTAREILSAGAQRIQQDLQDRPEVQARLQATIGAVYTSLGLYSNAEALLRQAADTQQRALGADHLETLETLNQLANAYWHLGRFQDAEPLYLDLVQRRGRTLGEDHPDTLRASYDLASLYVMQNRLAEAERLAEGVLHRQRRLLGPEHVDTQFSMSNLQAIYFRQGQYSKADLLAREVLQGHRRLLGEEHPETLIALHNVAAVSAALSKHEEAERLYKEVIAARRRVLGEAHPHNFGSYLGLSSVYQKQGRYDEAEKWALAAYQGYQSTFGAEHERTGGAVKHIIGLYETWRRTAKAAEWRARLEGR